MEIAGIRYYKDVNGETNCLVWDKKTRFYHINAVVDIYRSYLQSIRVSTKRRVWGYADFFHKKQFCVDGLFRSATKVRWIVYIVGKVHKSEL